MIMTAERLNNDMLGSMQYVQNKSKDIITEDKGKSQQKWHSM